MNWSLPALRLDRLPLGPIRLLASQWRLLAAALTAAAIIHILVTLTSVQFSEAQSYRTLVRGLPVNQVTFAPAVTYQAQPLPFFGADSLYSYCPYDASASRIRISVVLPESGWSLSLHTPKGENFYYVAGTNRQPTNIKLLLVPPGNVFAHGSTEVGKAEQAVPRIKLPHVRGVVILRSPQKGFAYRRRVDEMRSTFKCRAEN